MVRTQVQLTERQLDTLRESAPGVDGVEDRLKDQRTDVAAFVRFSRGVRHFY
jgi:hypothetical protein